MLDAVGFGFEPYSILLLTVIVQLPFALFTVSFAVAVPGFIVSVSSVSTVMVYVPADVTVSFPFSSVALSVSSKLYVAFPAPSPISKREVISIAFPSYVTSLSVAVIEGISFATKVFPANALLALVYPSPKVPSSFFIYILSGRHK